GRYLAGQRSDYPGIPSGYFDSTTEQRLARFQERALIDRRPALLAELPRLTLRRDIAKVTAAKAIFRSWLRYLADH
ncbi:MAG: homoserine O-succinyltransferase MetA, partial [Bradyrhizobium sp.]